MDIGETLRRRGVRRLAYLHTDHFEPWRHVPGREEDFARGIDDVEAFLRACEPLDFARRSTLFLKSNINFVVDKERSLYRAAPDDELGFVPRSETHKRIGRRMLRPIAQSAHETQLHLHHENFVWNGSLRDPGTRTYLATPHARSFDAARVELAVRLNLEILRRDADIELDRWFFVHGHWALNASDLDECTVVREIELLMRNGCAGDFTQPAGRPHVDSRVDEPYLVHPTARPKGYDSAAADPIAASGAASEAADRFFLWASKVTHRHASIDIHSPMTIKRAADPTSFGRVNAEDGFVLDGTLYVKTHGHSMQPAYWTEEGGGRFPHAHPAIQAELRTLFDAADAAGVEVSFITASEAYDAIVNGPPVPGRAPFAELYGLDREPAEMTATIVFRDANGTIVPPPPLAAHRPGVVPPGPAMPVAGPPDVFATIVSVDDLAHGEAPFVAVADEAKEAAPATPDRPPAPGNDPATVLDEQVNRAASRIAAERLAELGGEKSGVTGFYVTRGIEGTILHSPEIAVARVVAERFHRRRPIWEIGCGLGTLTTRLALDGFRAIGIDRNAARIATARAIADAAGCANTGVEFVIGRFPAATVERWGMADAVALVTNLLGAADAAEQLRFIRGLHGFGDVIVDLQRLFTRRMTASQFDEIVGMFRQVGFAPPDPLFDLGNDGHYVRFARARLPRLDSLGGLRRRADIALSLLHRLQPWR